LNLDARNEAPPRGPAGETRPQARLTSLRPKARRHDIGLHALRKQRAP
jgi:hypothetical protein